MKSPTLYRKILGTILGATLAISVLGAQALTISPARDEKTGDPGETVPGSLTLINEQNADFMLRVSL